VPADLLHHILRILFVGQERVDIATQVVVVGRDQLHEEIVARLAAFVAVVRCRLGAVWVGHGSGRDRRRWSELSHTLFACLGEKCHEPSPAAKNGTQPSSASGRQQLPGRRYNAQGRILGCRCL